jgi:hypothetical protein
MTTHTQPLSTQPLNHCRKQVSTHPKMQPQTRIEESSIPLDPWDRIIDMYSPIPYVALLEVSFFVEIRSYGFSQ